MRLLEHFGFAIIGIARVVAVFVLAYANRGTVALNPFALKIAAVATFLPALYLFYLVSVRSAPTTLTHLSAPCPSFEEVSSPMACTSTDFCCCGYPHCGGHPRRHFA
jgi:hypothetical protein